MNSKQLSIALQINRALQLATQNLELSDDKAMELADLYPKWSCPKAYKIGDIISYGVNADNETQLYRVQQDHISQEDWTPDSVESLYKKIGFTDDGVSIWTQPQGAHDAYEKGDVVSHNNKLWVSDVDSNVWEPGVYGWSEETATAVSEK